MINFLTPSSHQGLLQETLLKLLRSYKIFISHSWSYADSYERLIKLLRSKPGFFFHDISVPKDDPIHYAHNDVELYTAIKGKVDQSDIVLIFTGVYATYSRWIQHEILAAKGRGLLNLSPPKPILAIQEWGAQRTSTIVKTHADAVVRWSSDSIVSGIRMLARR